MFDNNKDFLGRKILNMFFFIDLFIIFLLGILYLVFESKTNDAVLRGLSIGLITAGSIAIAFVLFYICEIVLNNTINTKVKQYICHQNYQSALNYIAKVPQVKIFYDTYERLFYYKGLLNLYIDDLISAENFFNKININSALLDIQVFFNTIMYLLLINEEKQDYQVKENLHTCFGQNIESVRKNKQNITKNAKAIAVIEALLAGDLKRNENLLYDKTDIPLVARLLIK